MTHGPWPALGFQAEFDVLVFVFVMAGNAATEMKAERIFWHKAVVAGTTWRYLQEHQLSIDSYWGESVTWSLAYELADFWALGLDPYSEWSAVAASFVALTKVEGQEQQEPGQYGPHPTVFAWPSADPAAVVRYHSSTSSASDGSVRR